MVENREGTTINGIKIQERDIGKEAKCASIVGRHILSGRLVRNPQEEGDGCIIAEAKTGNLAVAIIDISLGRSHSSASLPIDNALRKIAASGELDGLTTSMPPPPGILQDRNCADNQIIESRILTDLKRFLNAFITKDMDLASHPAALLDKVRNHFSPDYLMRPHNSRSILWGYSLSLAYLDKQEEAIRIASFGKNFVGKQSFGKENEFTSVFGDNSQFYSKRKRHKGVGGPVGIKTTSLPWRQAFIMATDGINGRNRFPFPPKIVLQQIPDKKLINNNTEGLYLLVKPKLF